MAELLTTERMEIEMTATCVGCGYRAWDDEGFLDLPANKATLSITFLPEPNNPHDPNAIKVKFRGEHCGYVASEFLCDFHQFHEAFELMKPYLSEYGGFGVEVLDVKTRFNGAVNCFTFRVFAQADIPTDVAEAIDFL